MRAFQTVVDWVSKQMSDWGVRGVTVFALILLTIGLLIYAKGPTVLPQPPTPPPDLVDEANGARGADMPRASTVGATPNTTVPHVSIPGIKTNFYGSPNWSSRGFNPIEAIVVHVTGPGTCPGMRSWFANPSAAVSAHFGVCKDGSIEQYVEVSDAAWHAGIVSRPMTQSQIAQAWVTGNINPNARSIGIEVLLAPGENLNDYPAMRDSFYALLRWISQQTGVPLDRAHIIGHNELDSVNRSNDPVCCYSIDKVVQDLQTISVPEWGATDPVYGNRWNNWRQRWVSPDGNFEFDPKAPDAHWYCVKNCPSPLPLPALTAPVDAAGVWELIKLDYPLATVICAYDWPCGEALRTVYGPTPPNEQAPGGCPNGESTGNPLAGNQDISGLWQLSRKWNEFRFTNRGWTWDDAFNPERSTAIAHEIWEANGFAPWSCRL